jgi:redox-sensing transcriptional repressor
VRQLEAFQRQGQITVSSSQLGAALGINDAQVRKDLAVFGQFGQPGVGYRIEDLSQTLRRILGIDRVWPTAMIGLGNLGRALLRYRGFRGRGFHIVALFDNDARKLGQSHGGLSVQGLDELAATVAERQIGLAILCVPAEAAQAVADRLVACGVTGILNFAPLTLQVPPHVSVMPVDLSVQLEWLAYQVQNQRGDVRVAE